METNTESYDIRVNNTQISVETAAGNPSVSPKQLLSVSDNHPGSYALFVDQYADADAGEDIPTLLEERAGDRIPLDDDLDLAEHQQFVAILKRNL